MQKGTCLRFEVKVIPGAKKNVLRQAPYNPKGISTGQEGPIFKVYLTAPAVDGKANQALIEFLAEHYQVRKHQIEIIKGLKSRHKIINISDIPT